MDEGKTPGHMPFSTDPNEVFETQGPFCLYNTSSERLVHVKDPSAVLFEPRSIGFTAKKQTPNGGHGQRHRSVSVAHG